VSPLEQALTDYLRLRHSLGHELAEAAWLLPGFVAYLDAHGCPTVTVEADTSVIALWLGHAGVRSTDAYLHADITIKEKALALTTPASAKPGRYHPTDKMLAFLEGL